MQRVTAVGALEPYKLWVRFADRREGVVDLGDLFAQGGALAALRAPAEFAQVHVERDGRHVVWPGGVDLDPDALYARLG